jgi:hypothetical protein
MRCTFKETGDTGDRRGPRHECSRMGCGNYAFTKLPSDRIKATCRGWFAQSGLGDTIAWITKAVGIKPCGGCKKRQAKLNELFPYKE